MSRGRGVGIPRAGMTEKARILLVVILARVPAAREESRSFPDQNSTEKSTISSWRTAAGLCRTRGLADVRIIAAQPSRRDPGQEQRFDQPHFKHGANQPVLTPSASGSDDPRAQAGDASTAFQTARELDVFAQIDFLKSAHRHKYVAANENCLVAGRTAHDARAKVDQFAQQAPGQ